MKTRRLYKRLSTIGLGAAVASMGLTAIAQDALASGSSNDKPYGHAPGTLPFDFSSGYYRKNGVDPGGLTAHVTVRGPGLAVTETSNPDPTRNNIRILATNGGYDAGGALLYYPDPPAFMTPDAFMDNKKGEHAMQLADDFNVYIFPKREGPGWVPAPWNRRQDNIFDTGLGYLTHNPLGLWTINFVRYTDEVLAGTATPEQMEHFVMLAERNGLDIDGTPIMKRVHEVKDALEAGIVTSTTRIKPGDPAADPDDHPSRSAPPWVV